MESAKEVKSHSLPDASLQTLQKLRNENCSADAKEFHLQSFQIFLRRLMSPESPQRSMMIFHGTGTGKCHGIDTPILMHNGCVKMVQDIIEGDLLMGDDSTPRKVLSLARGRDEMYRVKSVKGDSYVVNKEHILCLKHTGTDDVREIAMKDFLKLSQKLQRNLKGYKVPIEFPAKEVPLDPYVLGVWLGDGSSRDSKITNQDAVILSYLRKFCQDNKAVLTYQRDYDYRITPCSKKDGNVFLKFLQNNDLIQNKHVPKDYKINSKEIRLQVLAGLIDTDGYLTHKTYEITQKSKQLADDIVFLARSVGLATTMRVVQKGCMYKGENRIGSYYRIFISGDNDMIPVKILRKKASKRSEFKDVLKHGFSVTPLGEGDYYGFTLDGNNRYVLGDFTVTHNTASAIQIAEEYIMRPEFQDKKVIVLAGKAVQGSFRNQIFDVSRAEDAGGQVTGRRYLDLLQRAQKERLRWEDAESREILTKTIKRIVDEFYQFEGYEAFANRIEKLQIQGGFPAVKKELENRLIIVDEAHNLRTGDVTSKLISTQVENIVKNVGGITLVLMTATPMFDTFEDIMFYFNLFLWNDKRQRADERLLVSDFFNNDGTFVSTAADARFRGYAHEYTSFIRGENPFTFPYRLPPPNELISLADRKIDPTGKEIKKPRKYLPLVGSTLQTPQKEQVESLTGSQRTDMIDTILVSPIPDRKLGQCFTKSSNENRFVYKYAPDVPTFLAPSLIANHAAKFKTILDCIKEGTGAIFVYSNFREFGIEMFAAALEEHGYEPYSGPRMLENPSKETNPGSSGKYVYLTESNIDKTLVTLKSKKNANGELIKVILGSPFVAEGVDFRYIRQVHVLDPWYNISRIDQVIGRGLRTCSHSALDFKEQNCTVYLHICRIPDSDKEAYDEFVYRNYVEGKAEAIARIKRVIQESAVDCSLQIMTNSLPQQWKDLLVPQIRSQDKKEITYKLSDLAGPSFEEGSSPLVCHPHPAKIDEGYVRPLSAYLDVKDEVFNLLLKIFKGKPVWSREDLLDHPDMIADKDVVQFLLDEALESHLRIKDSKGREGTLESKESMYAFKPVDAPEGATLAERVLTAKEMEKPFVPIETQPEEPKEEEEEIQEDALIDTMRQQYTWKYGLEKFPERVLNWYLVDTVLSKEEKPKLLLSLPRIGDLPDYMKGLVIPGYNFLALGSSKLYNDAGELVIPVGSEKDAYTNWITEHINNIVDAVKNEGRIICTMGENKAGLAVIKFAAFKVEDGQIKREKREKTITAKECSFYSISELETLAKTLNPSGFAEGVNKKDEMCSSLGVFVRNAIVQKNNLIYWVHPELMEILTTEPHKTTLRSKLK